MGIWGGQWEREASGRWPMGSSLSVFCPSQAKPKQSKREAACLREQTGCALWLVDDELADWLVAGGCSAPNVFLPFIYFSIFG